MSVAIAPEDPFYLDSLGWVYYRMGQLDKAEKILKQAVAIQDDPETRYPHSDRYADLITPDQYLTKPIDFDNLLESVNKLVQK